MSSSISLQPPEGRFCEFRTVVAVIEVFIKSLRSMRSMFSAAEIRRYFLRREAISSEGININEK